MKVQAGGGLPHSGPRLPSRAGRTETPPRSTWEVAEFERTRWDPKDGELSPGQDEARRKLLPDETDESCQVGHFGKQNLALRDETKPVKASDARPP
ncbi:hypothetical protein JTE90_007016 [Oedothorax gibbosus]|uniref:Uncharacterized protein n=1 Tax=Oedothorax gibbosus TaxID=931172 RepID=A0AAV6TEQ8_9ARAC|nr:hypothetical protein JTE90_007016 [Oedothorax gibbosus]